MQHTRIHVPLCRWRIPLGYTCGRPINTDPASIFLWLSVTRFVLGVGVGGVYPLSATIAAESSDKKSRGRTASLVFSMQVVAWAEDLFDI